MSKRPATRASLAALILLIPASAGASPSQREFATCEEQLAQANRREEAARCFYELAIGTSPLRSAGSKRLQELIAKYPENPWFPIYLGKVRWQNRDLQAAEDLYGLGARLAVLHAMADAEFSARWHLCRILRDAGRLDEGAAEVERAAAVARKSRRPALLLRADILRSMHWYAGGEFEQAYATLSRIQAAVEFEAERARGRQEAYLLLRDHLFTLAKVAQEIGRFEEARQAYRGVAERAVEAGDPALEAQARYGMATARLYEAIELPSEAGRREVLELAQGALAAARASGWSFMEMQPLWMIGFLGDADQAREPLERCFAVAATPGEQSACLTALARRLARTDPRRAEEAIREALTLAQESGSAQVQTAFWSHQMRVSWVLNPPGKALEDAQAALDAIEALRNRQERGTNQPGLFSTWAEHYYWLSGQLLEARQLEHAFGVIERMRSRTLIDALGLRITRADLAAVRFASLGQLRTALAPDEALLSFQIAPWKDLSGDFGGGSWLLVFTRGAVRLYRLPDRIWVRPAVNAFAGMFSARDGSEGQAASRLYKELVGPALAELPPGVRRLAIVPDDFLHRLPFAALRPEPESEPLAARYEITLAPSATLRLRWRETRPAPSGTPALVLADPVTSARLEPLPHARTEGKAVRRHLGGGELLLGKEASETYIKRNGAGPYGLLHFAAHAVTDEVNPDRSGVYLSPGNDKEDGLLQAREIVDLDLDGRIVVLSTCESASGGLLRGEGVMGLARAFFQAGAHTVVASLWPLRDDDGAALFDRFYRHLGKGKSVAAALQAAQRDRMDDGAPAEAWAGVVVLGDGDRVPLPGGRGPSLTVWILGLIAVLVLAYAARRAFQRRRTTA